MKTIKKQLTVIYKNILSTEHNENNTVLFENLYVIKKEYLQLKKQINNKSYLKKYPSTGKIIDIMLSLFDNGKIRNEKDIIFTLSDKNLTLLDSTLLSFFLYYGIFILCDENKDNEQILSEIFTSYHKIRELDFENILNNISKTEKLLNTDKIYPQMDDSTKALYRNAIIENSIKAKKTDYEYTLELFEKSKNYGDKTKQHIGFFIPSINSDNTKTGATLLTLEIIFPLLISFCLSILFSRISIFFFTLFPIYEIIKSLITLLSSQTVKDKPLLKMSADYIKNENYKTAIVISTLLFPNDDYSELKNKLISIYRTSNENNNYICLLADLKSTITENSPDDKKVYEKIKQINNELNSRYNNKFIFIIRNRSFCKTQNEYLGFERKRGAITEFCSAVKNIKSINGKIYGNTELLKNTKYITALDSDTFLPNGQLSVLLCAAAHPLNKPVISYKNKKVEKGYGIIMPKTETSLKSAHSTYFAHFFAGHGGLNGYSTLTGEKYQRILNKTIFTGKGLIDIECFNMLLTDRFENEKILSHDIMEGIILRTAYEGEATLTDSFPKNPLSYLSRQHRWIRGDVQNLLYVISKRQKLSFSEIYWLTDNVRRAFTPVAIFAGIIVSFFLPDREQTFITIASILGLCSGDLFTLFMSVLSGNIKFITRLYYSDTIPTPMQNIIHALISVSILPAEAVSNFDAIIRTLYRYSISKKNLLEWTTASQSDKKNKFSSLLLKGLFCGFTGWLIVAYYSNTAKTVGILFILSIPVFLLSGEKTKYGTNHKIKKEQADTIKQYALDIWKFFNNYVTEKDNMLPPDNVSFFPQYKIAHRTSPTNIGLYLVSLLGAKDMDYITDSVFFKKAKVTLDTIEKLPKFKGHLYNWYNTETLEILNPPYISTVDSGNFVASLVTFRQGLADYAKINFRLNELIEMCNKIIENTDFEFLYNKKRNLFHIGFNPVTNEKSTSYYDLLMSESRIISYYAVSKRIVPVKHLSALGRTIVSNGRHTGPVSWSGTMFEYYMPSLFIPAYKNSIYDEALKFCLDSQKKFSEKRNIPWGVSESCFFSFDNQLNYQYKANSVPALALCHTDRKAAVISPYSSFLALNTDLNGSLKNLLKIKTTGAYGKYGFYEAIDYTKSKINSQNYVVIKSYMAHHMGMSFISCVNAVKNNIMQSRFTSDEYTASALNLLEERVPLDSPVSKSKEENKKINIHQRLKRSESVSQNVSLLNPDCNLQTNGDMTFISSANGENVLIYKNISLFKKPNKDIISPVGLLSCAKINNTAVPFTFAPFYKNSEYFSSVYNNYSVTQKAEYKTVKLTREFKLHNDKNALSVKFRASSKLKTDGINLMLYFEPSLLDININDPHPAFSKLFITNEYIEGDKTTIFKRQPRNGGTSSYIACGFKENITFKHCFNRESVLSYPDGYFSLFKTKCDPLSVSADKCLFINADMIKKRADYECEFIITVADTKEEAIRTLKSLRHENVKHPKSLTPYELDSLTGIYTETVLKNIFFSPLKDKSITDRAIQNSLDISFLWKYGISGDVPIVTIYHITDTQTVISFLLLHKILTLSGINTELVFIVNDGDLYGNKEISKIRKILASENMANLENTKNGIFIINENTTDKNDINIIIAFSDSLFPKTKSKTAYSKLIPLKNASSPDTRKSDFISDGYLINNKTLLPHCTVLANPSFGTLVSNNSLGFTWAINSSQNRLTPWSNDTMTDNYSERLLISYNDDTVDIIKGSAVYFGKNSASWYSVYDNFTFRITADVPEKGMKKNITVSITNNSGSTKELSLMYYCEIILAQNGVHSQFIKAEIENNTAIFSNPLNSHYKGFACVSTNISDSEFIFGKFNYMLDNFIADNNSCTVKGKIILPPKKTEIYKFILSFGKTKESALNITAIKPQTKSKNGLTVSTGNKNFDTMFNVFLPMQIINSRLYGRTGFYQSSGAYGFRDQLQDSLSLIPTHSELTKKQIYRCASVQFIEGDVFHWFHIYPNKNGQTVFGNRTKCSDDFLWLPYAVGEYCLKTGEYTILEKRIPYLSGEELKDNENERCFESSYSSIKESLYLHCIRAINKSLEFGRHNLPLIKQGDWNDSFNAIGKGGTGESVWLGMFLKKTIDLFIPICEMLKDTERKEKYLSINNILTDSIENNAYDTDRYIRAFFDDGTPIGCEASEECKIDLLPQAFSVLSNMPNKNKNTIAIETAYNILVDKKYSLIKLFTPGFTTNGKYAGYVNAYPMGIRENAGQYTHAAVWLCTAFFKNNNPKKGYELLNMLMPYNKQKDIYKTEPYYLAGDVYYSEGMKGRGGWSLYTGSAGWLYKTIYEDVLGLKMNNGKIKMMPNLPKEIQNCKINIKINSNETEYRLN